MEKYIVVIEWKTDQVEETVTFSPWDCAREGENDDEICFFGLSKEDCIKDIGKDLPGLDFIIKEVY